MATITATLNEISRSLGHAGVLTDESVEACGDDLGLFAQAFEANVLGSNTIPAPQAMWQYAGDGGVSYTTGTGRLTIEADPFGLVIKVGSGEYPDSPILSISFSCLGSDVYGGEIMEFIPDAFVSRPDRVSLLLRVMRAASLFILPDEWDVLVAIEQAAVAMHVARSHAQAATRTLGYRRLAVLDEDYPRGLSYSPSDFAPLSANV